MSALKTPSHHTDPTLESVTRWLQEPCRDRFLVTSHVNPDGDGLASMLACGRILRTLGKQVWLVADGFLSPRYAYLPEIETIEAYHDGLEAELPVANVITVDVPTISRLERVERLVPPHAEILKIDHHPGDDHFGSLNYVDTAASSTAELVYHLCSALGVPFDPALGTWLYSGIAFDTGRFRFSSTSPSALIIATPLALFVARLPVAVAGIGVLEGALVFLLGLFGVPAVAAISIALAGRVVDIIAALPGAFLWADVAKELRPWRRQATPPAASLEPRPDLVSEKSTRGLDL